MRYVPEISVVVCCYNSARRIARVLSHLADQKGISRDRFEVLVINNCSSDSTTAVANETAAKLDLPLRIINEERPGLTYARELGIQESRGALIVFCDDDNYLSDNYLSVALENFSADPTLGGMVGYSQASAVPGSALPRWFPQVAGAYACHSQRPELSYPKALFGAGLVLRRAALTSLRASGFVPQLSDRKGNSLSSGGDFELTLALSIQGWRLMVDPRAEFIHEMDAKRLNAAYLRRLGRGVGAAVAVLLPYAWAAKGKSLSPLKSRFYLFMRALAQSILGLRWALWGLPGSVPARYQAAWEFSFAFGLVSLCASRQWRQTLDQVERLQRSKVF
jgi:glycosyltransferase involved in cell wall biosynthesis